MLITMDQPRKDGTIKRGTVLTDDQTGEILSERIEILSPEGIRIGIQSIRILIPDPERR